MRSLVGKQDLSVGCDKSRLHSKPLNEHYGLVTTAKWGCYTTYQLLRLRHQR